MIEIIKQEIRIITMFLILGVFVSCNRIPRDSTEPIVTINQETEPEYKTKIISIDKIFELGEDEVAVLENQNFSVRISKFHNSPCPPDVNCVWSGVGLALVYNSKGEEKKGINLVKAFGYRMTIVETDHETFAKLKINEINGSRI